MQTAPQPGSTPPKKGLSGCLVALLIAGAVTMIGGIAAAFFAYRAVNSPEGKKALQAAGEGLRAAKESQTAPGAAEVRALGCVQAQVLDLSKAFAVLDAGPQATEARVVICVAKPGSTTPTCEDVARTYVAALGGNAGAAFAVQVGEQGGEARCSGRYTAAGVRR